ncbi:MAG: hypothetical protein RL754_10 [Bacteroidota bacterium]|jgi:hypothetical protein
MGVNLHTELDKIRSKSDAMADVLTGFEELIKAPSNGERILKNLFNSTGNEEPLHFDQLDPERIYHLNDIKKLCIDYRLRFLDSSLFNGTFPTEALDAIASFEEEQGREITGFKMIAPAPMFKLAEKDKDPLLLVPMGNNYYYLLAQWGNDLNPLRKALVYPFRSFDTLFKSVLMLSAFIALSIPADVIRGPHDTYVVHLRVIFFFYLVFAIGAMTALYGFSRVKNFNSNLWKSRFLD